MLLAVWLFILHHRWRYDEKKLERWCRLCLIPFGITSVHYIIYVRTQTDLVRNYTPMYVIAVLMLDEKGDVNIDAKADMISRDPVEVRIPLDYEAAIKIFKFKEDHELEWARRYLEMK